MKFLTIESYHQNFEDILKSKLDEINGIICSVSDSLEPCISYNMPTFKYFGLLVHYAVYNNHLGFYPSPSAIIAFEQELSKYKTSKGAIQFPLDKPLPKKLIQAIVKFRMHENEEKAKVKKLKK